jgi:hypothetical protein
MKPLELDNVKIAFEALDNFRIEIPSWGFANTGTRFGKFVQAAAASHHRREICRRGRGQPPDRCNAHAGAACALGSAQRL